jgi:hypothetical protein
LILIASSRNYESCDWIERQKKYLLENTGMLNIGIGSELQKDVTDLNHSPAKRFDYVLPPDVF